MKCLYVGNFLDGTGWSNGAIGHALALDSVGVDVTCRSIKLNNTQGETPERLHSLLQKDVYGCDVVIQCVLPHMADYNGNFRRNIIQYYTETSNFKTVGWADHINTMSEAWVANKQSKQASIDSGVTIPLNVVPCAIDLSKFQQSYAPLPLRDNYKDKFIFYTVGEMNRRKNLVGLLKAFHLEFDPEEPVELLIKSTPVGVSAEGIQEVIKDVKTHLRLYPSLRDYKEEIVICEYWSEQDILRLHNSTDCFVSASFAEGFSLPCLDSLGFGQAIIAPRHGGFLEYLNNENSWLVEGRYEPVLGVPSNPSFPHLFSGRENWFSIDTLSLQSALRSAYEDKKLREEKKKNAIRRSQDFSYEKIGTIMKNLLEANC